MIEKVFKLGMIVHYRGSAWRITALSEEYVTIIHCMYDNIEEFKGSQEVTEFLKEAYDPMQNETTKESPL